MDAPEVIPQRVRPVKKPCVDGESQQHSPTPTSMEAAVSKVLDDDNLLIEILLRVGFPTTLVCAALVCKRWYHHASDRGFLCRFRKRHPPRLLGFYINRGLFSLESKATPYFVPMQPQPPELAAVMRRIASHSFGAYSDKLWIMDCRNGGVFTRRRDGSVLTHGVQHPHYPERAMHIVPPLPSAQDPSQQILSALLSKEEGGGGLSYMYVIAEWTMGTRNFKICVYVLQDGVWCMHTSATDQILLPPQAPNVVLSNNKIYITHSDGIIALDLTASSFSRIPLPQGVKYRCYHTSLSPADDASGVYLTHVHVKELQLCIWFHKGDNWLLVDNISLHQMLVNLRMLDHTLEDLDIYFRYISKVGDNAEFVFLEMCCFIFYLDVMSRKLRKVHGMTVKDRKFSDVYPFMMIWPPIFPALKDDPQEMPCEEEGYQEACGW